MFIDNKPQGHITTDTVGDGAHCCRINWKGHNVAQTVLVELLDKVVWSVECHPGVCLSRWVSI